VSFWGNWNWCKVYWYALGIYPLARGIYPKYTQNIPEIVLLQTHYSEMEQYILQIYHKYTVSRNTYTTSKLHALSPNILFH
jgi:hypothetical protein